ncbi:DUF2809 domain-containing protein [Agrobacterium rubi]|uniref:DUF2809 domain-containing protein n=1 Tax=Agrobacterium rubi TaxID=28099 RepID=A0AAE7UQ84_9HYPH|nr:DUF2809 domain-containing protein [Agrobacterium rubi]NTE86073.1 DUF2809 domain-containing protein [Agrobacterium rubi]NTF02004.1 DUF2809 domain-containing protein [Agrobacterium rubi]NTF36248.1 DUF2809 domain-containing protein [Agrobacterium rubi]QTG01329.1 DUF2809 domain-containing protein [Agrobacterium rubi]
MIEDRHAIYPRRIGLMIAACGVILAGLVLRRYGYAIGLPFFVVKYGGSVLWGSMVYLLVASILPSRTVRGAVIVACLAAVAVELVRLIHFPALDAFRATSAGALLLGRVFSLWNIACYVAGIGMAALIGTRLWQT